ncbi:MAG: HAD-IA family hydrolase [Pseudonocardiales bacterium]|nr:HAD-IA family hydrolase [Pseudonocardiales bacterium]
MLSAVVFDVDGTLADTERDGHRPAFNRAFADHGLPYRWDVPTYGRLLRVTGGRRRIERYLLEQGCPEASSLAPVLHRAKTDHFVEWVRSGPLSCRPGVDTLIDDLRRHEIRLAVATTGRRAWVEPLLERLFDPSVFEAIITGDDVRHLKPSPDAYLAALVALGLPRDVVLAVEDSAPGLAAARAAGLTCLVVTNAYTADSALLGAAAVRASFEGLCASDCSALLTAH